MIRAGPVLLALAGLRAVRRYPLLLDATLRLATLERSRDLTLLEHAVDELCHYESIEWWLVAADRLVQLAGPDQSPRGAAARDRVLARMLAIPALFRLDAGSRGRLLELLEAIGAERVAAVPDAHKLRTLTALIGVAPKGEALFRQLIALVRPDQDWRQRLVSRLDQRLDAGSVSPAELARIAGRTGWAEFGAQAGQPGTPHGPPQRKPGRAAEIARAVENGEPWRGRLLAAEAGLGLTVPDDAAAAMAELLARQHLPLEPALALAGELAARGFTAAAAALAAPHVAESERAALLHARLTEAGLDPDARVRLWHDLRQIHPGAALAQHHAVALADALEYDRAITVQDAAVAADPARSGPARARIRLSERIGALGDAAELAREFAVGRPADAALAGEATRLARAIGERDSSAPATERAEAEHAIAASGAAAAIPHLEAAFARSGSASDAGALMNAVLLAGEVERGSELARRFGQRFAGDARFPLKEAQLAERDGEHAVALDRFAAALDRSPSDRAARAGIARALIYTGRLGAARDWLDLCAGSGDLAFWTDPLRAFLELRAGDRPAAEAALARAYDAGRRHLAAYRAGRDLGDRDVYLLDGRHRVHPSERAATSMTLWDGFLAALGEGRTVLVGNSPKLLGSGLGHAIDASHAIVRLNDFRIAGFEADIGSRTDYWFSSANRQAEPDRASVAGAIAFLQQGRAVHFPELPAFAKGRMGLDLDPRRAGFLPPYVHMLSDALLYPVPTTGMRVMLILEFLCQQPFRAIGFDFFASASMHYFDKGATRLRVGESHAVGFERDFASEVLGVIGRYAQFG